jgi:hypothetical protein
MTKFKKRAFLFRVFFLLTLSSNALTVMSQKGVEHKLADNQYRTASEGGGRIIKVDTTQNLQVLISNLDNQWEFEETGKAYWIGYTELMYTIAHHKKKAIPLLLNHYANTNSRFGKEGVISTLHLIGIQSTIAGRFIEKFIDTSARKALLSLFLFNQDNEALATLLWRDPWQSDIVFYKENLSKIKFPPSVNNLFARYNLPNAPINPVLPTSKYDTVHFYYQSKDSTLFIGSLINNCDSQKLVKYENEKYDCCLGKYRCFDLNEKNYNFFENKLKSYSFFESEKSNNYLENLLEKYCRNSHRKDPFTYIHINNPLYYTTQDNKIIIVEPNIVTEFWMDFIRKF